MSDNRKFLVAFEIDPSVTIAHARELALGIAVELNAIVRNNSQLKLDMKPQTFFGAKVPGLAELLPKEKK